MSEHLKTMDISQQQAFLNQLIPSHRDPNFDAIFARLTRPLSTSERFLLKMEFNRLVSPTSRLIDLREKVDDECQAFTYQGLIHYLDDFSLENFKQHIRIYGGQYTLGVYEAVLAKIHDDRARSHIELKHNLTVKALHFGHYHGRVEERMHLSLPIQIKLPNGNRIDAMSSNMSISGIRIKVPEHLHFSRGMSLVVYFTGLSREYANEVCMQGTLYQLMGIEKKPQGQWLRLRLVNSDDPLVHFLKSFLNAYRGRYRVDVTHLISSLIAKGHEQFFVPRTCSLPLYFVGQQPPSLKYILNNENNQELRSYWCNEKKESVLGQLFHPTRITQLATTPSGQCLIYSFTHTKANRLYYYSATDQELIKYPALKALFFDLGTQRPSWRVFKFQWHQTTVKASFLQPLLPTENSERQTVQLKHQLADLSLVGLLTDITDAKLTALYRQRYRSDANPNELAMFGQYRYPMTPFTQVAHKYAQLRNSDRYLHRSLVEVKTPQGPISGWMVDFSVGGMKLEVDTPLNVEINEVIELALPQFQKLTNSYTLADLPYRVANHNAQKTIINLQIHGRQNSGSEFFKVLIRNNAAKLAVAPELKPLEGLSEALRNIYCYQLFKRVLFINKEGSRLKLKTLAYGEQTQNMDTLLGLTRSEHQALLTDLFSWGDINTELLTPLKALEHSDHPFTRRIFFATQRDTGKLLAARNMDQFEDNKAMSSFVKKALELGQFICLQLTVSRVGRPDTQYIKNEMKYIEQFALHKAKELEHELWSVFGIIEIDDLTDEWLNLLEVEPHHL
jgi:hypothetical protein